VHKTGDFITLDNESNELIDTLSEKESNMHADIQEKLEDVVDLVHKTMTNPDIELTYHIPDVAMTAENAEITRDPYIHLKYVVNEDHVQEQNIPIKHVYLQKSAEDLSNLVTFYIEQFIEEIDSVEYGAQ
jgi:hypothetical protein